MNFYAAFETRFLLNDIPENLSAIFVFTNLGDCKIAYVLQNKWKYGILYCQNLH